MKEFSRYRKAVSFLEGLANLPIEGDYMIDKDHADIYLKRMRYFLHLLGDPDRGMKFIHIAGTSGKGSVTNMVHEMLLAADKKVGSFTSPFVTTSIEKIKVADKYISPDEFADIVDDIKPCIDQAYIEGPYGRPSYFEIFFAIALMYFQKMRCEWVVLEVGLGGRYDATNVIVDPIVTAITNIDYDHTDILGKTLKKIAWDKAGIIKRGSAFFTTERRKQILGIFKGICDKERVKFASLSPKAGYREHNDALASAISAHLGIDSRDIKRGLLHSKLMCRFEVMQTSPTVVLDGAHNRAKIRSTIDNIKELDYNKLHLIIGIAENKDHRPILREIVPWADSVYFTRFQIKDRKCAHPKKLRQEAKKYLKRGARSEIYLDPEVAMRRTLKRASRSDIVLAVGSFFLAGELRKLWHPEEMILWRRRMI